MPTFLPNRQHASEPTRLTAYAASSALPRKTGKPGARDRSAERRITAIAACRMCGAETSRNARFCYGCGSTSQIRLYPGGAQAGAVLFAGVVIAQRAYTENRDRRTAPNLPSVRLERGKNEALKTTCRNRRERGRPVVNVSQSSSSGRVLPREPDANPVEGVRTWLITSNNLTPWHLTLSRAPPSAP